jgi:hypothetical protein
MSKRIETNHRNAQHSTGPKTVEGKERSSQNALRHGLRSELPVLPGERAEEWEAHRTGIVQSLAPAGALETELAGRVALCLWRLRRVAAYEIGVTAVGLEEAVEEAQRVKPDPLAPLGQEKPVAARLQKAREDLEKKRELVAMWEGSLRLLRDLPGLPDEAGVCGDDAYGLLEDISGELPGAEDESFDVEDRAFLTRLGVPADEVHDAWNWEGWTAGMVRKAVDQMAREFKTDPNKLVAKALRGREGIQAEGKKEVRRLGQEVRRLEQKVQEKEARLRQRRILPEDRTLDKVVRYEAHVGRQMLQALHTLERLQKARAGEHVPPPGAIDVTVDGEVPGLPAAGDATLS